jgi:hypothetical protein
LPLVYKIDTAGGKDAVGLGDVSLGMRWQPIPLKAWLANHNFLFISCLPQQVIVLTKSTVLKTWQQVKVITVCLLV